ncbi:hypothetical protein [Oxynema aestuarii]|uniref:Uncharacterized protein n=1 Tax=Oxynema aestuarii AP17 TaxID=2064643 RepID=A0A6H1TZ81_9CYAN|nr:hypothetical protein [Oxynema aestuarii]QIZ71715.1 hypothetical protein HCG48_14925 [Oxynema aestuarii AP17]RMH72942.1 MAG: hypothetical protein D6680_17915 [Cyanobacteria bacterium J007]
MRTQASIILCGLLLAGFAGSQGKEPASQGDRFSRWETLPSSVRGQQSEEICPHRGSGRCEVTEGLHPDRAIANSALSSSLPGLRSHGS